MKKKETATEFKDDQRVVPDFSSDMFSNKEQEEICKKVKLCLESDLRDMEVWIEGRAKDLQRYQGEMPSRIENLDKEDWQADRNLGMTTATCDAYQATLLATCYNPDRIHWKSTKSGTADRSDNLERFTRWAVGPQEADIHGEIDDFIHNRVTQGTSYLKVGWKVWHKWIDRRIPKYDTSTNPPRFVKYEVKPEKVRLERGYVENISDVSDLLYPTRGNNLQTKDHLIHRVKVTADKILKRGEKGEYLNVDDNYKVKLKRYIHNHILDTLSSEKQEDLGLKDVDDIPDEYLKHYEITIYEWYGQHEKADGNDEEYRFTVDVETMTFLQGKPLRKINRKAKRPFVGGGLIRRPGMVQGKSLPDLIANPADAMNNIFNQKQDFQYVENCPYFFYEPSDPNQKSVYELRPGRGYPSENPSGIQFPNNSRSMAWAQQDFDLLFQVIERLTGAASYFMTNKEGVSGTATRDAIINEKSETRFGLMVNRLINDISEGITMFINQYQDWAPPDLGERVLGDDGKQLFPNMSLETLMGEYDAYLSPDIISGSKTMEREIAVWGLQNLAVTPWFDPMVNPRGNWELTNNAAKKMGMDNVDSMMPPKPKAEWSQTEDVEQKFGQIKQGQVPEITANDDIMTLFMGFTDIKSLKYHELDEEYQPIFDAFYFKLGVEMMKVQQKMMAERMSNAIAMQHIQETEGQKDKTPPKGQLPITPPDAMNVSMDEGV